jgi:hypothetical protein
LQRSDSFPARLPSHPLQRTEARHERTSITRPKPDARPPEDFREGGGKRQGAEVKYEFMKLVEENHFLRDWLAPKIEGNPEYMQCLESAHPRIRSYSPEQKEKAYYDFAFSHPALSAKIAKKRNELYAVPNYPTSRRCMKPAEQKFLTEAMRLIREDAENKPFHMHGEWGVVGDRSGAIVEFTHNPMGSVDLSSAQGDKYFLHSHPPFGQPFDSSPSETDHRVAAKLYMEFDNKAKEYLTDGKAVLHFPPANMELIRLHPDPKAENAIGKFPVAFTLPDPRLPARPFANHESPAAFPGNWQPPAGWKPPEDYPKD